MVRRVHRTPLASRLAITAVACVVALTTLGATVLALMTVLVAVPLAVVTYRARSRTPR